MIPSAPELPAIPIHQHTPLVDALLAIIDQQSKQIAAQQEQIARQQEQITRQQEQIAVQKEQIQGLKDEIARLKGAKGIIILHSDKIATFPFSAIVNTVANRFVALQEEVGNPLSLDSFVSQPAMDRALALVDLDFDKLKDMADDKNFRPMPLGLRADVALRQTRHRFSSPNVIGVLPGTSKADEAVMFMAHHDHLGVRLLLLYPFEELFPSYSGHLQISHDHIEVDMVHELDSLFGGACCVYVLTVFDKDRFK